MSSLSGQVTLVTGAARGIGAAIALRYARAGAKVVITDLDAAQAHTMAEQARALGAETDAFAADVSNPQESTRMIARVTEKFGRVDVLVNNAGVVRVRTLMNTTPEDWDFLHNVNARGLFFTLQAGAKQMLQQAPLAPGRPRGKIINIASIAGRVGRPMLGAYAASKAAAISITKTAAWEFAPDLTVNAICPGVVGTDMWKQIDREWSEQAQRPPGSAWEERLRNIPMKRAETPEDLGGIALFFASSDADYITGQCYNVDGGVVLS